MPLAIAIAALGIPAQTVILGGPRSPKLDQTRPGFVAVTRHPLLLAPALWLLSHLFPNGDLTHVTLFGGFALMALATMPASDAHALFLAPVQGGSRFLRRDGAPVITPLVQGRLFLSAAV